jgi:hypothetical protein
MILSSGERAVWAAEYVRERDEQMDEYWHQGYLAEMDGGALTQTDEEAFASASHEAAFAACKAVNELRKTRDSWEEVHRQHPEMNDDDLRMLRAMLGEE